MEKKIDLWGVIEELSTEQEQNVVGSGCSCACAWSHCGGSSSSDNNSANESSDRQPFLQTFS